MPKAIGRFVIRGEIGRGANGVVYAALDSVLGREVAIKAIALGSDASFRRRIEASFLQEAKNAAGLSHPAIVTVYDAGKTADLAYIAMERLYGRDLHQFIASGERLSVIQAATLIARVADAIHYAHRRGLIHRDIKPSNVLLLADFKPKVLDFGIAVPHLEQRLPGRQRQLVGTPNYMSPEQALGRTLDARSDIFSLGTILYELLAGRRAFDGDSTDEILAQVIADDPPPIESLRNDLPPALIEIVGRSLSKDLNRRFESALALRNALVAVATPADAGRGDGSRTAAGNPPTRTAEVIPLSRAVVVAAPPDAQAGAATVAEVPPPAEGFLRRHMVTMASVVLALAAAAALYVANGQRENAASPSAASGKITLFSSPPANGARGNAPGAAAGSTAIAPPVVPAPGAPAVAGTATAGGVPPAAPAGQALAQPVPGTMASPPENPAAEGAARHAAVARKAARKAVVPPPAPADGVLNLAISPWGEVSVNGTPRGIAPPLARLSLPPGNYTIVVRNGDRPPYSTEIDVRSGETVAVQHRF